MRRIVLGWGLAAVVAAGGMRAMAQAGPVAEGACTLEHEVYHCNWPSFRQRFDASQTVALDVSPRDHTVDSQLRQLAKDLGKAVVPGSEQGQADLTMLLIPTDRPGINIGPAGEDLATLRIYGAGHDSQRGPLLWAETLHDQPDLPWPAQVQRLIQQFRSHFRLR